MPHYLAGLEVHDFKVLSGALVPEDPDGIVVDAPAASEESLVPAA
jgi:hypothetical protein